MLIDANIFLEGIFKRENAPRCRLFLEDVWKGNKQAYMSTFTIDSIILVMLRNRIGKEQIINFLSNLSLFRGLKLYQTKIIDRKNALILMNKYSLDYEDATILQCAISTNSEELVSFDKHFDKIKEIKRVEP